MTRYLPLAIVAAGWAFVVAYAHPGVMSVDSHYQLVQARTGAWGNWHPPVMAALWGVLDRIVAGPLLLLLLQTSLFALGLFALARRYFAPRTAAIVTAAMLVFPPVFVVLAGAWKDALMAALLVCGAAGLLSARRPARAGGWIALVLASALRHNAALIVVPLVAMLARLPAGWPAWRQRAAGALLGIAVAVTGALGDHALTRVDEHPFANMLAMSDVAGTIAHAPELSDAEVRALLAGTPLRGAPDHLQARLRELRVERSGWESLALGDDRLFDLATTDEQADALVAAWKHAIAAYPGAYAAHRLSVFGRTMGWNGPKPNFTTPLDEPSELLASIGETRSYDGFQRAVSRGLHAIRKWPLFSPILYLVLAAGLLVVLWRDPLQRGLLGGALVYELSLVVLSPGGHDFRYVHWLVVVSVFAAIVHVGAALRERHLHEQQVDHQEPERGPSHGAQHRSDAPGSVRAGG
ncbi:MAG: hypothetical protein ACM31C_23970 [Acidobacteriota bacterium]